MIEIKIKDADLQAAAAKGLDEFVDLFADAINAAIGPQLTAENMAQLNASQITLLAYKTLQAEVMDGGFIQLIHNGYGGFIFDNPFAYAIKQWGLRDLSKIVYAAGKLYHRYADKLTADCTDDEFMALFEQYPEFDDCDDAFVEGEEDFTAGVACYIDGHIDEFCTVI